MTKPLDVCAQCAGLQGAYRDADWRNTTPVDPARNRVGISIDDQHEGTFRYALSLDSAMRLAETLLHALHALHAIGATSDAYVPRPKGVTLTIKPATVADEWYLDIDRNGRFNARYMSMTVEKLMGRALPEAMGEAREMHQAMNQV